MGYLDASGGLPISPQYDIAQPFSSGLALVAAMSSADGKRGFIGKRGEFLIKPTFCRAQAFAEGLAAVQVNGHWGFIDTTGTFVVEPQFDYVRQFCSGEAVVGVGDIGNEQWSMIDTSGEVVFRCPPNCRISGFSEGLAVMLPSPMSFTEYWYVDRNGEQAFPGRFRIADSFQRVERL